MKVIHSVIGPWGTWGRRLKCQAGHFVKGAKIRDQAKQGWGRLRDNTAANGMKFECTNGQILTPGNGFWGSWSTMKTCPEGDAIYGIKTTVERMKQRGDNSALNRVKFLCRKRPDGNETISIPSFKFAMFWFVHYFYSNG